MKSAAPSVPCSGATSGAAGHSTTSNSDMKRCIEAWKRSQSKMERSISSAVRLLCLWGCHSLSERDQTRDQYATVIGIDSSRRGGLASVTDAPPARKAWAAARVAAITSGAVVVPGIDAYQATRRAETSD